MFLPVSRVPRWLPPALLTLAMILLTGLLATNFIGLAALYLPAALSLSGASVPL